VEQVVTRTWIDASRCRFVAGGLVGETCRGGRGKGRAEVLVMMTFLAPCFCFAKETHIVIRHRHYMVSSTIRMRSAS